MDIRESIFNWNLGLQSFPVFLIKVVETKSNAGKYNCNPMPIKTAQNF